MERRASAPTKADAQALPESTVNLKWLNADY